MFSVSNSYNFVLFTDGQNVVTECCRVGEFEYAGVDRSRQSRCMATSIWVCWLPEASSCVSRCHHTAAVLSTSVA